MLGKEFERPRYKGDKERQLGQPADNVKYSHPKQEHKQIQKIGAKKFFTQIPARQLLSLIMRDLVYQKENPTIICQKMFLTLGL